jgi:apolipoprotein N-acyltransferase
VTANGVGQRRFLWLGLGVALLLVANGRWIFPLATWFFAVGWIAYLDRSRPLRGLTLAFAAYVLTYFVIWQGIIPAPGVLYYLVAATYAAAYFLPFVAHRLLSRGATGVQATLVFPLAWVSIELLFSRWVTPYGSWASLAYTQSELLALLQLASVTGTAGITFVVTWCSSVVAWVLRPGLSAHSRVRVAAVFAVALFTALAFGQVRLMDDPAHPSVRAPGLVPSASALDELERSMRPVRHGASVSDSEMRAITRAAEHLNEDLIRRTRREARAGARIIAWSETAGRVLASEEDEFLARVGQLAAEERVVLLLAVGLWHQDRSPPFDNMVVAVDTTGVVAWQYHKAHPIIGAEAPFITTGDGIVRSLDGEFGRLGAVICHDLDFPRLLRQLRTQNIGLVVAPSDDWTDIAVLHARMAVFRAVENGVTLFRPTNGGRSIAVDARGRILARVDFPEDAFVAHVAAQRVGTVYGVIGDLFSWWCLAGLASIALLAWRDRTARPKKPDPNLAAPSREAA